MINIISYYIQETDFTVEYEEEQQEHHFEKIYNDEDTLLSCKYCHNFTTRDNGDCEDCYGVNLISCEQCCGFKNYEWRGGRTMDRYRQTANDCFCFNKFYIQVEFNQKDTVKQLGARWDNQCKSWYIYANNDYYCDIIKRYKITKIVQVERYNRYNIEYYVKF